MRKMTRVQVSSWLLTIATGMFFAGLVFDIGWMQTFAAFEVAVRALHVAHLNNNERL